VYSTIHNAFNLRKLNGWSVQYNW